MSNLMHKVKEAMMGHQNSDSSAKHDTQGESSTANKMNEVRDTYGSSTTDTKDYGTHDPTMNKIENTSDTYGSPNMESSNYGTTGYSSGSHYDSSKGSSNYSSPAMDPSNDGSGMNTGNYSVFNAFDSSNVNAGADDSNVPNQLDPRVDSDLDNRGIYGATTGSQVATSTDYPGTSDKYGPATNVSTQGPEYGTVAGDIHGNSGHTYNTRSNLSNQMEPRAEPEMESQTQHIDFGGAAAGGSSYNAPRSSNGRKYSGPVHTSNLLNKLDPRVRTLDSDSSNTTSNQRSGC